MCCIDGYWQWRYNEMRCLLAPQVFIDWTDILTCLISQSTHSDGSALTAQVGSVGWQRKMRSWVESMALGAVWHEMICEPRTVLPTPTTFPANMQRIDRSRREALWPSAAGQTTTSGNEDLTTISLQILHNHTALTQSATKVTQTNNAKTHYILVAKQQQQQQHHANLYQTYTPP